ncbi:WAT1-related protein At3g28050 [Linum grandiflorum]
MTGFRFQRDVVPFAVMVSLQIINVGINTLFKAATMEGMNYHVFIAYDYAIASLTLVPAPFISARSTLLPPLSSSVMCKIGLLGIIGSSSQIMAYTGINYSSPTLASAIGNLTPAFTFLFAIIFRMERVCIRRSSSQAKLVGTVVAIAGAFVVTLYKGPPVFIMPPSPSPSPSTQLNHYLHSSTTQHWVLGGICLSAKYILDPLWYIVLTQIMKEYPAELTVIFFYNLFVCITTAVFALMTEGTLSSVWMLSTNTALASVFCSGVLGSSLSNGVDAWVLRVKGPVFVSMFKPFAMIVAVTMGVMFLGDILHIGSLIGATTIAIGFYTLMWGKSKEESEEQSHVSSSSLLLPHSTEKVPLLQSYKVAEGVVNNSG